MNYNSTSHIVSVQDVKAFFHYLAFDENVSFHPDDDFSDYENSSVGTPAFSKQEALLYNRLMDEAFDVCDKEGVDIYELGFEETYNAIIAKRNSIQETTKIPFNVNKQILEIWNN